MMRTAVQEATAAALAELSGERGRWVTMQQIADHMGKSYQSVQQAFSRMQIHDVHAYKLSYQGRRIEIRKGFGVRLRSGVDVVGQSVLAC